MGMRGKRTRFKRRNILNIIRCKLIRLIFSIFIGETLGYYGKSVYLALAFGKQGLFEAARNGGGRKKSSLKVLHKERKVVQELGCFLGEDVVLLRGHPRVKKETNRHDSRVCWPYTGV